MWVPSTKWFLKKKFISPLLLLTSSLPSLPTFFSPPPPSLPPLPPFLIFFLHYFFVFLLLLFSFFPYFSPCSYLSHSLFPCFLFFSFNFKKNVLLLEACWNNMRRELGGATITSWAFFLWNDFPCVHLCKISRRWCFFTRDYDIAQ